MRAPSKHQLQCTGEPAQPRSYPARQFRGKSALVDGAIALAEPRQGHSRAALRSSPRSRRRARATRRRRCAPPYSCRDAMPKVSATRSSKAWIRSWAWSMRPSTETGTSVGDSARSSRRRGRPLDCRALREWLLKGDAPGDRGERVRRENPAGARRKGRSQGRHPRDDGGLSELAGWESETHVDARSHAQPRCVR